MHTGPYKMTDEVIETICDKLRQGCYPETACAFAGISLSTFHKWLKYGANDEDGPFFRFRLAVDLAMAECEQEYLKILRDAAANGDVSSVKFLLERRFSQRWGNRQQVEHTGKEGGPITVATIDSDALLREIRSITGGETDDPGAVSDASGGIEEGSSRTGG